ncbi:MAG: hypothetical protein ACTSYB_13380, partial [Candidatus Helarchaeota archaeon]
EQLDSIKISYNELQEKLDELTANFDNLHQDIITLMIEDIEQMMAQEQKVEKTYKELSKKSQDSEKVHNAFIKENTKLNEAFQNLEKIISLSEIAFHEISAQKEILRSAIEKLEKEIQESTKKILSLSTQQSKELSSAFTEIQVLKHKIEELLKSSNNFQEKIENALNNLDKGNKIISNIEKRKNNINKVIEKTTKYIFPEIIQKQRAFLTEFDEKSQNLITKGHEFKLTLKSEFQNLSQNFKQKLKTLSKAIQNIESKASKALDAVKFQETQQFFQEMNESSEMEKKDQEIKPKNTGSEENLPLTDKELGIKQHCPYCNAIIPEKLLNLLRKGFKPECAECGEMLDPKDIELD